MSTPRVLPSMSWIVPTFKVSSSQSWCIPFLPPATYYTSKSLRATIWPFPSYHYFSPVLEAPSPDPFIHQIPFVQLPPSFLLSLYSYRYIPACFQFSPSLLPASTPFKRQAPSLLPYAYGPMTSFQFVLFCSLIHFPSALPTSFLCSRSFRVLPFNSRLSFCP